MRNKHMTTGFWVAVLGGAWATAAAGDSKLQLTAELLGPNPMPLQAIRVRVRLTNVGGERSDPLAPTFAVSSVERPSGETYNPTLGKLFLSDPQAILRGEGEAGPERIILQPGETVSRSYALQAQWGRKLHPLFGEPGQCIVHFRHSWGGQSVGTRLVVNVEAPNGEDAAAYELMQGNVKVQRAMLSPYYSPHREAIGLLEEIADRYPHSSYAPYADYGLARAGLNGTRVREGTSKVQMRTVLKRLESATVDGFPMAPHALLMQKRLAIGDPARTREIDRVLQEKYGDALVMLRD